LKSACVEEQRFSSSSPENATTCCARTGVARHSTAASTARCLTLLLPTIGRKRLSGGATLGDRTAAAYRPSAITGMGRTWKITSSASRSSGWAGVLALHSCPRRRHNEPHTPPKPLPGWPRVANASFRRPIWIGQWPIYHMKRKSNMGGRPGGLRRGQRDGLLVFFPEPHSQNRSDT
jgi:hypothetical protein